MVLDSNVLEINEFIRVISSEVDSYKLSRKVKGAKYYEVPSAFDIETSSFYENGEKRACMYVWQFGINGHVCMGRTWRELKRLYKQIIEVLGLTEETRLICGVHNLSFEFQWICKRFEWSNVFAVKSRTPAYALTVDGLEFRCTYLLSGYSLAKLSEQLQTYKVSKLVGDLDYKLIRHSKTPLTDKEIQYCVHDVLVVMAYLQERIETDGSIARIPLTKTGYVRRYCRKNCFFPHGSKGKNRFDRLRYAGMIKKLTIEPDEYMQMKRAFSGGFTHAGGFYSNTCVHGVTSFDFTSSYPYVMISEQFPMSKGELIELKDENHFYNCIENYSCIFDLELYDVEDTFIYEHYISSSKCFICEGAVIDNGRIVSAKRIKLTVTELDYFIIDKTYTYSECIITNLYRYMRAYLPTNLVKCILELYKNKTILKGVKGSEVEYLASKEMINSVYGMMVTDIVREVNEYKNGHWIEGYLPDLQKSLNEYNGGFNRFNFYAWGIFVTAYARYNLWTGIYEFGSDYVYSDTDSIKVINSGHHQEYIEAYNDEARRKLKLACMYHNIDVSATEPKTIKGIKKPLGVWDFDGDYKTFKTLGAKRYMVHYSDDVRNDKSDRGKLNITVSGLNKKITVPYMCEGWQTDIQTHKEKNNPFDKFKNGLYVPAEFTGKNTHTYIDTKTSGTVTDYLGHACKYSEKSSIHMEGADYSLGISQEYIDYLLDINDMEV